MQVGCSVALLPFLISCFIWLQLVTRLPLIKYSMIMLVFLMLFFFSSRRRHTRLQGDWSSDVCSSDLARVLGGLRRPDQGLGRHAPEVETVAAHRLHDARVMRVLERVLLGERRPRPETEIGRASCRERV